MTEFKDIHRRRLEKGLSEMKIELPVEAASQLMEFLRMLVKWNRVYNLSAIKEAEQMIDLHLLDSLAILPFLHGQRCIDVGTGAGLPGIPLAIARPDMMFSLLDSNSKKTRFIQQVCIDLGLKNVQVVHERVENYQPSQRFDTLTARAFTGLPDLLTKTRHLLCSNGKLLAMKSKETDKLEREDYTFESLQSLAIPGLEATRNLVIYVAT